MSGDENSKQDTQPVFNHLRKIAEDTSAAIVIVHHANKTGGYRGSSAIKGAVDTMVQVCSESGKNTINFKSEKTRDDLPSEFGAVATWQNDTFTLRPWEATGSGVFHSKSKEYVLRYLGAHSPATLSLIHI